MKNSKRTYSLKRTLAFVSALSMIGSFSQTIGIFSPLSYKGIAAVATEDGGNDITENINYNKIDVEVSNQLNLDNDISCTVSVYKENVDDAKLVLKKKIEIGGSKNSSDTVTTGYIEDGTYYVVIEAPGFKSFQKEITNFTHMQCTLKVTLGFNSLYTYTDIEKTDKDGNIVLNEDKEPVIIDGDDGHPGVMPIGDLNNDGEIDEEDKEILLEAIDYAVKNDGKIKDEEVPVDLTRDGKVNLADLTLFAKSFVDTSNWSTEATIITELSEKYKLDSVKKEELLPKVKSNGVSITDLILGSESESEDESGSESEGEGENGNKKVKESSPKVMQLSPEAYVRAVDEEGNPIVDEKGNPVYVQEVDEEGNLIFDKEGNPVYKPVPITKDNPVGFDLELKNPVPKIDFATTADAGYFVIETEDGELPNPIEFGENIHNLSNEEAKNEDGHLSNGESDVKASIDNAGNISINFGNQIAVKKIRLVITDVKNTNLCEIAEVKFLNGMESRLAPPEADAPVNVKVSQMTGTNNKNIGINITWDKCVNITGYEVEVSTSSATKEDGSFVSKIPEEAGQEFNKFPTNNKLSLQSQHGNFKLIKANTTYYVHVRTVANDDYKSKWSETSRVVTKACNAPDKPDEVKAKGGFKSLKVNWKADNTNSTTNYDIHYRKICKDENADKNAQEYEWKNIENIGKTTSYEITGLEDTTEYEVYVVSKNEFGQSPESVHASAETSDSSIFADMPKYKMINCDENGNPGSTHIVSVKRYGGEMLNSELDENFADSAWGAVDGDKNSYYSKNSWDDGGFNGIGNNGLTYTFDQDYTLDTIGILTTTNISYTNVRCWDSTGKLVYQLNDGYTNLTSYKTDSKNKGYYMLKLPKAVTASKVQISLARYLASPVTVVETYFYHYDSTMDEIMALYVDALHTVLRDDVTQNTIDELRTKINTPDEITGEYNPNKAALERELATAEKILNAEQISDPVVIHNGITTVDTGRNFSGLNAWQPLGVTIGVNTEVTIYVGSSTQKTGDSTNLRLICTQYNSESGGVSPEGANLVVGANTFKLTKGSMAGAEAGGALYIQYQGDSNANVQYSVRVTGGSEVPILDLYNVTDDDERWYRAYDYIEALDKYVANMEEEHNRVHKGAKTYDGKINTKLNYDYKEATCILGATDILCDQMMFSLPAPQILAGLGKGSTEERAEILIKSMSSMEEMMTLFYQHKGISPYATNAVDQTPKQHLNIRYQRMFSGAFMYAAGNHIGIQWGSAPAMFNSKSVTSDENGKYVSGSYFGWGIAHEIGHCLNDSSYVVPEITNNYYSLLSQAEDKNAGSRLNYNNIFKKVTSGTKGSADQGTQLGMYWQLHLAYDKDYNYKTYNSEKEILNSLFYARMDTYSRTPSKAPQPEGIALTLSGDSDQKLMRLACAAAEKNVLEFFERWGKTPDATTRSYASQFSKEKRAIMYANEDSRVYAMNGKGSSLVSEDGNAVSVIDNVSVKVGTGTTANKVNLSINVSDKINSKDILGYEIIRCTISNGNVKETPIGFATSPKFTDTVTTLNNRTVSYKVTLIDQYLNRSETFVTDMVKVQHDGSIDKSHWSISTSGFAAEAVSYESAHEDALPCERVTVNPAATAIDDNLNTVYSPKVTSNTAQIVMNFNQTFTITGMKYTAGSTEDSIGKYKVYVTENEGATWIEVASGSFKGSETIYFSNTDNKYVSTYDATALKLEILDQNNKNISIAELDVLGVTGDNVDFRKDGETTQAAFGILSEDYKYGEDEEDVIYKGSLVFTGSYKGHPAYNVVILYNEKGEIVGKTKDGKNGNSYQTIMADVPDGSLITDVSNGSWIYWIEPEDIDNIKWPEKVRVELYRVNDAKKNEGQRMVSDSLFETIVAQEKMPKIKLNGGKKFDTKVTTTANTEVATTANTEVTTAGNDE